MIALICPTRSRPENMKRMWQSALATARNPESLRLVLGLDKDQLELYEPYLPKDCSIHTLGDWGVVHSINRMAEFVLLNHQSIKLFMVAPDDVIFTTPEWDKALIEHYEALKNKIHVYCLLDSRSENGTPHPIITREYIEVMGYLFPPIFMHWYVDTWTAEMANNAKCFTHLKDYELVHDKPSDRGMQDETFSRVRARGWNTRDEYVNKKCKHLLELEKSRLRVAMSTAEAA